MWFLHHLAVDLRYTETQIATILQALQHHLRTQSYSTTMFQDAITRLARKATKEDPRLKHIRLTLKRRLPVTFDVLRYLEETLLSLSSDDMND